MTPEMSRRPLPGRRPDDRRPTTNAEFVTTSLGRWHVRRAGTGPPAVLWHSLFVDSHSWGPLFDMVAGHRSVIAVDGPSHGRSTALDRVVTFPACVRAAVEVLDELGITEPVDWVGNAWGGHVGIMLAAAAPQRVRSLTTIGTPLRGLRAKERWTKVWPLVALYRLGGPTAIVVRALSDALLGADAVAADPDRAAAILDSFRAVDRTGMVHAMRSMMLGRPDLTGQLRQVTVPTLLLAAADDSMGWQPADARAVTAGFPGLRVGAVAGTGHVSPLLLDPIGVGTDVMRFWDSIVD